MRTLHSRAHSGTFVLAVVLSIAFSLLLHSPTADAAHIPGPRHAFKSNTSSISNTPSVTFSSSASFSRSGTLSNSDTVTPPPTPTKTISITASVSGTSSQSVSTSVSLTTSLTPVITLSPSVSLSQMTMTFSSTWAETHTPTISLSVSLTLSGETETFSETMAPTESMVITGSGTETFSVGLTTSALPQTTSVPLSTTLTLRSSCPSCQHGICSVDTSYLCICYRDTIRGFWDGGAPTGGTCNDCVEGYVGINCRDSCPGSACNPCNGHGKCNGGVKGDGTCTCDRSEETGYWDGASCDRCLGNYYGTHCKALCECNGHGACSAGRFGRGACDCFEGYSGRGCSVCDPDIVSPCIRCPNLCSNHGSCGNAQSGSIGQCQCDQYWAGEDCSIGCPLGCSNAGNCSDGIFGTGNCSCNLNHEPPACDRCTPEFWGPSCNLTCNCSGHGRCDRLAEICYCDEGYAGVRCETACERSANGAVCGGHGECRAEGGSSCRCFKSSKTGYWTSTSCSDCAEGYGGPECKDVCPRSLGGEICANRGRCGYSNESGCVCDGDYCGAACEGRLNSTGFCSPCIDDGMYGSTCELRCNCINGECDEGIFGTGKCTCFRGWHGEACDKECPGGWMTPCSDHGVCNPTNGRCTCETNYSTSDCSVLCPNCTHGRCDSGSGGSGECICDDLWVFPDTGCDQFCNCSGHGICHRNLTCSCHSSWGGENCSSCVDGRSGENCDKRCVHGTTQGRECVCEEFVGGEECENRCPYFDGYPCGNHRGWCAETSKLDGRCKCRPGLFEGPACQCDVKECAGATGLRQCNTTTGACECRSNRAGEGCQECSRAFWGSDCTETCECSGHGSCERISGACQCDGSQSTGFWSGDRCSICADRYVGESCKDPSVEITQLPSLQSRYVIGANQSLTTTNNFILHDRVHQTMIAGGSHYQVAFPTNSSKQGESSSFFTATTEDHTFCAAHINSWLIGSTFYMFASSGTACNDAYRLFRAPTPAPTTGWIGNSGSIIDTTSLTVVGSALYLTAIRSSGSSDPTATEEALILCYVPAYSSPFNIELTCHRTGLDGGGPPRKETIKLEGFRSVTKVTYSAYMRGVAIAGFGPSGCIVEMFQPNADTFEIIKIREFEVYSHQPQCVQIDCLQEEGTLLVVGMSIPQAVYMQVWSLVTLLPSGRLIVLPSGQCSALAIDEESDMGLIVFQRLTSTTVVKFIAYYRQEADQQNTGTPFLSVLGVKVLPNMVLSAIEIDAAERMAFGVAKTSIGIVMLRFLMLDVLSIQPKFVDRRGGTRVTVTGRGFNDFHADTLTCKFGQHDTSPATYVTNNTIECDAPAVTEFSCDAQPVEVTMNGWGFTTHSIGVMRIEPATIASSTPNRIRSTDSRSVTVHGKGFIGTGTLLCRYADGVHSFTVPASYVSRTEVVCSSFENADSNGDKKDKKSEPLDRILYANGTVDVSLDGGRFTEVPTPFVIVGPLHHVDCEPPLIQNSSAVRTTFATLVSAVAKDARNNTIGDLDVPTQRVLRYWFQRSADTSNVTSTQNMVAGRSTFMNPEFGYPTVGDITFHITVDDIFRTSFVIRVVQGTLHRLNITQQPSPEIFSGERLARNPRLVLLDISDNRWHPDQVTTIKPGIQSDGIHRAFFAPEIVSANGEVEFFNLPVDSRFGVRVALSFRVEEYPNVPVVVSTMIRANCAESDFRFEDPESGELSCIKCPDGAICEGTEKIILKDGYWRQNTSIPIVYKCDRSENCLGGSEAGVCREGNTGPMCTLCVDEFGKNQAGVCTECGKRSIVLLKVIGTVLLSFIAVIIVILLCIQYYDDEDHPLILPFILLDFGQAMTTLRFLDVGWAEFMEDMFSWAGMITDFELHSLASDCELRWQGKTYLDKAVFYYSSLLFVPVLALIIKSILRVFPNVFLKKSLFTAFDATANLVGANNAKITRRVAKAGRDRGFDDHSRHDAVLGAAPGGGFSNEVPRNHEFLPVVSVTLQVYMFLSYQTTSNHALNVFECRSIVRGATPESLLAQDFSVNCDSLLYEQAYGAAVFVSVLYGLALPVTSTVLTAACVSRFKGEKADLRKVFLSFQLLGFRDGCWYWQSVVLIRKFVTLVVAIWNPYPLDAFLSLWVFYLYTLLVWKVRPYEKDIYNFIDIVAFYSISSTINGGLLYKVSPWQALRISVLIVIFALYAALAGLIVYFSLGKLRSLVRRFLKLVFQLRLEHEGENDGALDDNDVVEHSDGNVGLGGDEEEDPAAAAAATAATKRNMSAVAALQKEMEKEGFEDYFNVEDINRIDGSGVGGVGGVNDAARGLPEGSGVKDAGSGESPPDSSSVFVAPTPPRGGTKSDDPQHQKQHALLQQPLLHRGIGSGEHSPTTTTAHASLGSPTSSSSAPSTAAATAGGGGGGSHSHHNPLGQHNEFPPRDVLKR